MYQDGEIVYEGEWKNDKPVKAKKRKRNATNEAKQVKIKKER